MLLAQKELADRTLLATKLPLPGAAVGAAAIRLDGSHDVDFWG